jgi:hypothetical protein
VLLEPNVLIPRRLQVEGSEFIIENGVGNDMLCSGMVTVADATPTYEILHLTEGGFRFIVSEVDTDILIDAGLLSPD